MKVPGTEFGENEVPGNLPQADFWTASSLAHRTSFFIAASVLGYTSKLMGRTDGTKIECQAIDLVPHVRVRRTKAS
jgi:hypothetical protein